MKTIRLLLSVLLLSALSQLAHAQETVDHRNAARTAPFRLPPYIPGSCTTGDFYFDLLNKLWACGPDNTWSQGFAFQGASNTANGPVVLDASANATFPGSVTIGTTLLLPVPANGATVDTAAQINAALALLPGGGSLTLGNGVWYTTGAICVPSNVTLQGSGRTTLRPKTGAKSTCNANGQAWGGAVVAAGVSNVVVQDLAIDEQTNGSTDNGIEVGFSGTGPSVASSNVIVQRCTIIQNGTHQYGIWAYGASHVRILHNYTDGKVATPTAAGVDEDGIESLGATDVVIDGNMSVNHNGNGIGIFARGGPNTVTNNIVANATVGVGVTGNAGYQITNTSISGNQISSTASYGVFASQVATGTIDGLLIDANILDATHGIIIDGVSGSVWNTATISGNIIKNTITTASGGAIAVSYADAVMIAGNMVTTSDYYGIRADVSAGLMLIQNLISGTSQQPLFLNQVTLKGQNTVMSTADMVCAHGGDTVGGVACSNAAGTEATVRTAFPTGWSIPAGYWQAGTTVRICGQFQSWSSATADNITDIGLSIGSGPLVLTSHLGTINTAASLSASGWSMCWRLTSSTNAGDHIYAQPESGSYPVAAAVSLHNTTFQPQNPGNVAQTLVVAVKFAAAGIYSAAYTSGGSFSGTGSCTLGTFNGGGSAGAATIAVSGGTPGAITITNTGYGYSSAPTTATLSSGTATCSGTPIVTSVLGGAQGNGILKPVLTVEAIE